MAHWPLNEASGTTAFDKVGGYAAVLTNGASWSSGRLGGGVQLDGTDDYLALPSLDIYDGALTLAAWVNITSYPAAVEQRIISKSTGAEDAAQYWTLSQVRTGGQNFVRFQLRAGGTTGTLISSVTAMPARVWCHVAGTFDGSTMRLFLNGQEIGRLTKSGTIDTNARAPVNIGRSPDGSNYLRGSVDDVRIYNRALAASEIAALMEDSGELPADTTAPSIPSGLQVLAVSPTEARMQWSPSIDDTAVASYRLRRNGIVIATTEATTYSDARLAAATTYEYAVSATDAAGNESAPSAAVAVTTPRSDTVSPKLTGLATTGLGASEATIIWSTDEPSTSKVDYGFTRKYGSSAGDHILKTSHSIRLTALKPETTYHYRVIASDAAGNSTRSKDVVFTTAASAEEPIAGPIVYWCLDEGAGSTSSDCAGDETASLAGGAGWTQGRLRYAVSLNGTDGYLSAPPFDIAGSKLTITAWIKHGGFAAGVDQRIIAKAAGSDEADHYWMLSHATVNGSNRLQFRLKTGSETTTLVASGGDLPTNHWYHAAATYDGASMTIYLDGVEVGRTSKSGPIATNANVPVNIGRSPDGSHYLTGAIDDLRIYNRALAAADVTEVMNEAGPMPADTTAPSTPSGLKVTAASATEIHLEWTASTDDVGVKGYRVRRNGVVIATTPAPSYADAGLSSSTAYGYTVSAFDEAGNTSDESLPVAETTLDPDTAPPRISDLRATSITESAATITWTTHEPSTSTLDYGLTTTYGFAAKEDNLATLHSLQITALEPGRIYHYRVTSVDEAGNVSWSADMIFATPSANQPPLIALTAPAAGATYMAPATITLEASASDPENRMAEVRFFSGTTLLATDTTAPYTFSWSSVPAGSYSLTATARDADGKTATSGAVTVNVQAVNQPPNVAITAPTQGATLAASSTLIVTASASDPENRLSEVQFYAASLLLCRDTTAPYSCAWPSIPAGVHTLTAVARDADGASTTSPVVGITVAAGTSPWRVGFTASADHDTMVLNYILEIFASGADPNTSSPMTSSDLGKPTPDASREIVVDLTAVFEALVPGNYVMTVKAISFDGVAARSAPLAFAR